MFIIVDNVCSAEKTVKKLYDVRYENIGNSQYRCVSLSTLRFFTCGGCEVNVDAGNSTMVTKQYTCNPINTSGVRNYECTSVDNNEPKVIKNYKFRNLTIQKGCTCCEETTVTTVNVEVPS